MSGRTRRPHPVLCSFRIENSIESTLFVEQRVFRCVCFFILATYSYLLFLLYIQGDIKEVIRNRFFRLQIYYHFLAISTTLAKKALNFFFIFALSVIKNSKHLSGSRPQTGYLYMPFPSSS